MHLLHLYCNYAHPDNPCSVRLDTGVCDGSSLSRQARAQVPQNPLTWERYLLAYLYISAMATLVLNSFRYFFIKTEKREENISRMEHVSSSTASRH